MTARPTIRVGLALNSSGGKGVEP
ncbi:hypothetical protein SMALA_6219 [Streptomyces malaysiensis subsp. malaysiensis]|nr:hypothetical protein SMALA_6219 [Streptomyces malaysiensis]